MSKAQTVKVYAPVQGFTDADSRGFARIAGVEFRDGVAEVEASNGAALNYFRSAGYGIGEPAPPPPAAAEPADPRHVTHIHTGGRLRDAAVDPRPDDHRPPSNAGKANPHGPQVVAR